MAKGKRRPPPKRSRVVVCASLTADVAERLDAFGARECERVGLEPRRGTLAAMLIRKGLEVVEAEGSAA